MPTKKMIEMRPIPTVDHVGVRNRGEIRANLVGMALYTAMESVVRAVGKMVVSVLAMAELSTIRTRS
jgi:hypothetical protein